MSYTSPTPEQPPQSENPTQPPTATERLHAAVLAHAAGDGETAWAERMAVVSEIDPTDPRYPGAVVAAAFAGRTFNDEWSKLITIGEAGIQAADEQLEQLAYNHPDGHNETDHRVTTLSEERVASCLHVGSMVMGLAARMELRGQPSKDDMMLARTHIERAWHASAGLRKGDYAGVAHQTRINAARRHAAILGLTGQPVAGLKAAAKSVGMSPLSESPRLARNNTEGMGLRTRIRAKAKVFGGGIAAVAVCALNAPGIQAIGRKKSLEIVTRMEKAGPHIY